MIPQNSQSKISKNQYELAEETSRSEDSLSNQQNQNHEALPKKEKRYIQAGTGLAGLVGILYLIYHHYISPTLSPDVLMNSQYNFQIYCPINKITHPLPAQIQIVKQFESVSNELRMLTTEMLAKRTTDIDQYIIYVQMRRLSPSDTNSKLFFCSYVTSWDEANCSNAVPLCTVPGPILYAERNKPIQVAWVYDIKNDDGTKQFDVSFGPCMKSSGLNPSEKHYCTLQQKKKGFETCTFLHPTSLTPNSALDRTFTMSLSNIPFVTHIHGLEVRPAFDGNPMAWLGKLGEVGPAFNSLLLGEKYFDNGLFKNSTKSTFLPIPGWNHTYAKVNRYDNIQLPGNLWYHDHAMHLTQDNVGHGLVGDYIIYDPEVEKQLPARTYDIFIVIGQHITKSQLVRDKAYKMMNPEKMTHELKVNPNVPFFSQTDLTLMRNQTYRIRLLNGMFDAVFTNLRFKTECVVVPGQPIDPKTCRKLLKFTVIGSDSALFNIPVHNVTKITISSAQRFEFLIVFDGNMGSLQQNQISNHAKRVVLVDGKDTVKHQFLLMPKTSIPNNYNKLPSQLVQLKGLHFYDLTQVNQLCAFTKVSNPTQCISKFRMKPTFKKSGVHFFNGHYDFMKNGKTDNPKIGTTEDWVFISLTHRHPIHMHLINFQIIGITTLKNYTVSFGEKDSKFQCTFYEMDYWVASGLLAPSDNYTQLCLEAQKIDIRNETVQSILDKAFPEDTPNPDNSSVIGFNVYEEVANESERVRYNTLASCSNKYKYICGPVSNKDIPPQYRRWKEVALLQNHTVLVLRVRWASTDYLVNGKGSYPYFNTPEDQLIEYPGYVYHCHFLQHEDNKLMRSFQMMPSDEFEKHYKVDGTPLGNCMARRGLKNKDGWDARYQCVNQLIGCPAK